MPWLRLVFEPAAPDRERLETALQATGALAVTLQGAGSEPILEPAPGETPLWSCTRISALFDAQVDIGSMLGRLRAELHVDALPPHGVEMIADRVWEREWLEAAKPLHFGSRLWICPGETSPDVKAAGDHPAIVVRLDAGLAFGAGTHASTALCLDWLATHELSGAELIDYGCGSGILAIAALKLGARHVTAIDIDPQARVATCTNALRNGIAHALVIADESPAAPLVCDVLLANILAATLIELSARFASMVKPGGRLVLAGILEPQVGAVADAYRTWFDIGVAHRREEWVRIDAVRRI